MKPSFRRWLDQQLGRQDAIGVLAELARSLPRHALSSPNKLRTFLFRVSKARPESEECHEAFLTAHVAHHEYEGTPICIPDLREWWEIWGKTLRPPKPN